MGTRTATADRADVVARLRAHLTRVAPARCNVGHLPTGIGALDVHVHGWPRPGIAEVHGPPGTGRLALLLPVLRELTAEGRTVAVVDVPGWLHPPGLPGVDPARLLVVRPGTSRAAWAAEQLVRSGALPLVLLLDPPPLRRAAHRLARAVETGDSALVVVGDRLDPDLAPALRIHLCGPRRARVSRGARGADLELSLDPPADLGGAAPARWRRPE